MNHEFSVYDPNDKGPSKYGPRRLYKGGGGGQSSTTIPTIPNELKPLANLYTQQATQVANTPYQAYQGQRYADLNGTQNQALQMIQNRATGGNQLSDTGSGYLQNLLTSGNQQATQNPYGNISAGTNNTQVNPGVNTSTVNAGANPYSGSNPYLQQNIDAAMNDVTRNYMHATAPALATAGVNSGSFGNSGLQQVQADQQTALAQQLGKISNSMRMQDYTQQQGLAENALNRNMQAQQFNSGVTDSNLNRAMQAQQFNSGVTDSNLNRDMNAQQFNATQGNDWAGRNDSMLNSQNAQKLSGLGMVPTYANQAYNDASQLLNAGNIKQNLAQNNLDFGYQQFQDRLNYPFKQLQAMGGVLGQNMGSTTVQKGGGK